VFVLLFSDLAIPSAYVSRVVIKDGNTEGGVIARCAALLCDALDVNGLLTFLISLYG
jgi:hypothetical protein